MNRKKVAKWLAAAGSLAVLTSCRGELVPYAAERTSEFLTAEPVILRDREAGRRFLMETVSAAEREGRQEIVVTGKDSSFDTLVIAQMFPGVVNISKLDLGTRNVNGETVTDCRIGFEWRGRAPDSGENTVPGTGDKFGEEEDRAHGGPGMWSRGRLREKYAGFDVSMMITRTAEAVMGNVRCFWRKM